MRLPAFRSADTLYAVQRRPDGAQAGIVAAHLFAPVPVGGGSRAGRAAGGATGCQPVPACGAAQQQKNWGRDVKRRRSNDLSTKAASGAASVPVAVVASRIEAELIVGLLRNNGLTAAVSADDAGGQEPQLQIQGVRVLVPPSEEASARRLLAEADDTPSEAG